MASMKALWSMRPVQSGIKALGAGTVLLGTYWGLNALAQKTIGSNTAHKTILEMMPEKAQQIDYLRDHDPDFCDLILRLSDFRNFEPEAFHVIVQTCADAVWLQQHVYSTGQLSASKSFQVRKAYQAIIEAVRVYRAILEDRVPSALEDFDEVAVDFNAKVEQACSDAIQDSLN